MKNYVVGICSTFENEVKLFRVKAKNEYEAVKKGMLLFCEDSPKGLSYEQEWQNSSQYPTDLVGLVGAYEEIPFNVIEV